MGKGIAVPRDSYTQSVKEALSSPVLGSMLLPPSGSAGFAERMAHFLQTAVVFP